MKDCPKCGTVYTDDTLSFCLSDGTQLVSQIIGNKTQKFSNLVVDIKTDDDLADETQQTNLPTRETLVSNQQDVEKKGVSPIWIFATFGLLTIMMIGGVAFWFFSRDTSVTANVSNQNGFQNNTIINNSNLNNTQTTINNSNLNNTQTTPTAQPTKTATATPKANTYKVVGVKSNDVLYIRPQAGNLKVVVGKIPPNAAGIKIIGGVKRVGKSRWVLISYNGKKGWVNSKFIAKQ